MGRLVHSAPSHVGRYQIWKEETVLCAVFVLCASSILVAVSAETPSPIDATAVPPGEAAIETGREVSVPDVSGAPTISPGPTPVNRATSPESTSTGSLLGDQGPTANVRQNDLATTTTVAGPPPAIDKPTKSDKLPPTPGTASNRSTDAATSVMQTAAPAAGSATTSVSSSVADGTGSPSPSLVNNTLLIGPSAASSNDTQWNDTAPTVGGGANATAPLSTPATMAPPPPTRTPPRTETPPPTETPSPTKTPSPPIRTSYRSTESVSAVSNRTVTYAAANETAAGGYGDEPTGDNSDHEKDDLNKLLVIIACSIGGLILSIVVVFLIVYHVAKKRAKKADRQYYTFKKKKTSRLNYDKVLHYHDRFAEADGDPSAATTGAAWVFSEDDPDAAAKTITLELKGKSAASERPAKAPAIAAAGSRPTRSRNKNANNRNKKAKRGDYHALTDMFPTGNNIPPDVLLSTEGAVACQDGDDGAFPVQQVTCLNNSSSNEPTSNNCHQSDGSASPVGGRAPSGEAWPSWNTSPDVKITHDEAVIEL